MRDIKPTYTANDGSSYSADEIAEAARQTGDE